MNVLRKALCTSIAAALGLGAPARALAHAPEPDGEDESAVAPAESEVSEAPTEQVELRNGGKIEGRIVELLPGESLTIDSTASGERRTFAWSEVARYTERGAWVTVAGPEEPPRRRRSGYGPRLHIETTRPARVKLYEITSEMVAAGGNVVVHGITFRSVCTSPCDQEIDVSAGHPFFFGGDGVTVSRRFNFEEYGDVTAKVKPGRKAVWTTGVIFLGTGPATIVLGATWLGIRKIRAENPGYDDVGNPLPPETARTGGPIAVMVVGSALLVGGIAMMIAGRTRFRLSTGGLGLARPLRFG